MCGFLLDVGMIFATFSFKKSYFFVESFEFFSLILKDAVSKILLHSFFNWMLRLHNERLNFNFIPLGHFFDILKDNNNSLSLIVLPSFFSMLYSLLSYCSNVPWRITLQIWCSQGLHQIFQQNKKLCRYDVRKDLNKFVNKMGHFADVTTCTTTATTTARS